MSERVKDFLAREMAGFVPKSDEHQRQTGRFFHDHNWPIYTEEQQRGDFAFNCWKKWMWLRTLGTIPEDGG